MQRAGNGTARRWRLWRVAAAGAADADHGVEVDGPALLVLGDLGEGHARVLAEAPLGQAGALGALSARVGGNAPPERTGVGVPEHGGFLAVGVRGERGSRAPPLSPQSAANRTSHKVP